MKKSAIILLHLGYWTCYLILMLFITLLLKGRFIFQNLSLFIFLSVFAFIPAILCFYSFYSFLFKKFLQQRKIIALVVASIAIAFICGCLGWILLNLAWSHIGPLRKAPINQGGPEEVISMVTIVSLNAFLNGIIALVIRGFINWYADIKLKEELNKKNYEMELALVKSQINPHFLFNTINNIDVLIEMDSAKASAYLNKLSDILRFMLYETKTEKVTLAKELSYIEKYIELQKIRTANSSYINFQVIGDADNRMIATMVLIPFIENAFKHAENKKEGNAINIGVNIENEKICFTCQNKFSQSLSIEAAHSGLGNELIKRRLALLYPNKHSLVINHENAVYSVVLILSSNED